MTAAATIPVLPRYACTKCGLAVAITPEGVPIRGCKHDTAGIVANATSKLGGIGGLKQGP